MKQRTARCATYGYIQYDCMGVYSKEVDIEYNWVARLLCPACWMVPKRVPAFQEWPRARENPSWDDPAYKGSKQVTSINQRGGRGQTTRKTWKKTATGASKHRLKDPGLSQLILCVQCADCFAVGWNSFPSWRCRRCRWRKVHGRWWIIHNTSVLVREHML